MRVARLPTRVETESRSLAEIEKSQGLSEKLVAAATQKKKTPKVLIACALFTCLTILE
jgi:hypothetical protein